MGDLRAVCCIPGATVSHSSGTLACSFPSALVLYVTSPQHSNHAETILSTVSHDVYDLWDLHQALGPVVRYGPNDLSMAAWDMYKQTYVPQNSPYLKDQAYYWAFVHKEVLEFFLSSVHLKSSLNCATQYLRLSTHKAR